MKLIFSTVAMLTLVAGGATSAKAEDPLPSWNDGPAKQAILAFVKEVTDNKSNPKYVAPEDRIATFDQDGTLWVEHRVALSNRRIVAVDAQHQTVTFTYRDYRHGSQLKELTLCAREFIRRFSLHIPALSPLRP